MLGPLTIFRASWKICTSQIRKINWSKENSRGNSRPAIFNQATHYRRSRKSHRCMSLITISCLQIWRISSLKPWKPAVLRDSGQFYRREPRATSSRDWARRSPEAAAEITSPPESLGHKQIQVMIGNTSPMPPISWCGAAINWTF